MSARDYDSVYGVPLFDDIHNYFPALLYDSSSFSNVQQVLTYIQTQMRRRLDLFSRNQAAYQRAHQQRAPPSPSFPGRVPAFYTTTDVRHSFNEPVNVHNRVVRGINHTDDLLHFFSAFLGAPTTFSNVVVRPSLEQINTATTLSTDVAATTDICAICQDGFVIGNERRQLNVCHHVFHKTCIDTWFQENVHCPVCRYDIRVTAAPTGET